MSVVKRIKRITGSGYLKDAKDRHMVARTVRTMKAESLIRKDSKGKYRKYNRPGSAGATKLVRRFRRGK